MNRALVVLVASVLFLEAPTAVVLDTDQALVQRALEPGTGFRTWYGALGAGVYLRVDAIGPKITLDLPKERYHYDGVDLWMQDVRPLSDALDPGPTPVKLPALYAARVGEVWTEARAGFPNTTFVVETPDAVDPTWTPDPFHTQAWYRVQLPFSWT